MISWMRIAAALMIVALAGGCSGQADSRRDDTSAPLTASSSAPRPAPSGAPPRIVALGDSLTAGLGLPTEQAYPALLQQRLNQKGLNYEVVNAGVSGDTSAGGLSRFDWAMQGNVRILIVALGGNDGLRGLPTEALKSNLGHIIERAQARHIKVILAGMEAPPNYGRVYFVSFHRVFPALAQQYNVPLVPFLLEGVGGIARLNQPDLIHPNAEGARIVADNVWAVLKPVVDEDRRAGS
jgi:acyl-CoA thioesterase-1